MEDILQPAQESIASSHATGDNLTRGSKQLHVNVQQFIRSS